MEGGHNIICYKVIVDPSTPISALLEAPLVKGVYKPLKVKPSTKASDAVRLCREDCIAIALIDEEDRLVKALSFHKVASELVVKGDFTLSEAPWSLTALPLNATVERLVEELIMHGEPVIVVDSVGRPLYAVDISILSDLLQEEIDLEEVKAAD